MSYDFYKIMHFVGIFLIFSALGAQLLHYMLGGEKKYAASGIIGASHGIGLLLALVGGFGLLARLQIGFPGWIYVKLGVWVAFGGLGALAARKKNLAKPLWFILIGLGWLAAYVARTKPF